jgi:O-antigen/teichoic acid export membrane protein
MAILMVGLAFLFAAYLTAPVLTLHERTRTTAVVNAVAAAINVVLDIVLLAVLGMGVAAPAIATTVALAFVFGAFSVCAGRAVGIPIRPDPVLLLPLAVGLASVLLLPGWVGTVVGLGGVLIVAAAILVLRCPFTRTDADVISKLDLPASVSRAATRLILWVT